MTGKQIRAIIRKKGQKQAHIAKQIGVSRFHMNKVLANDLPLTDGLEEKIIGWLEENVK